MSDNSNDNPDMDLIMSLKNDASGPGASMFQLDENDDTTTSAMDGLSDSGNDSTLSNYDQSANANNKSSSKPSAEDLETAATIAMML